jgi:SAM-dependent methyltransferase
MHVSLVRRAKNTVRLLTAGRVRSFQTVLSFVAGKKGLEIGGPSTAFQKWFQPLPIYHRVESLDNCDISRVTTWTTHADAYTFSPHKPPGKNIFVDASDLSCIADRSYDFVLSSHNLEHFANPVKALYEWRRVTRPGGGLILLLPNYLRTFDHRRSPTTVDHMFQDFHENTPENDLFHLPEILEKHDFSLDPGSTSVEEFHRRSLDNFNNRCLTLRTAVNCLFAPALRSLPWSYRFPTISSCSHGFPEAFSLRLVAVANGISRCVRQK